MPEELIKFAEFVCWVDGDPFDPDLIDDMKSSNWVEGVEHALLELTTGERAIVKGGRNGIRFQVEGRDGSRCLCFEIEGRRVYVAQILWHTHPKPTGPSDGDLETRSCPEETCGASHSGCILSSYLRSRLGASFLWPDERGTPWTT